MILINGGGIIPINMTVIRKIGNDTANVHSLTFLLEPPEQEDIEKAKIGLKFIETDSRKVRNILGKDITIGDRLTVDIKIDNSQSRLEDIKTPKDQEAEVKKEIDKELKKPGRKPKKEMTD